MVQNIISMITGFNTDVEYNKKVYHVQTEDKGLDNPYIESLIYVGGAIIFSKRTSYAEKLSSGITEKEIRALMENQHKTIIVAIKKGRFEELVAPKEKKEGKVVKVEEEEPSKKSLDEMIKTHMQKAAASDTLELIVPKDIEFFAGGKYSFKVFCRTSITEKPIPNAKVHVKILTTFMGTAELSNGISNEKGEAFLNFEIPAFKHGNAAIVILGISKDFGTGEYKQLVRKA